MRDLFKVKHGNWGARPGNKGHVLDHQVVLPFIAHWMFLHMWYKRGFRMESYTFCNFNLSNCSGMEKRLLTSWTHSQKLSSSLHLSNTSVSRVTDPRAHNSFENWWKVWTFYIQKCWCSFKDFTVNLNVVQISQVVNPLWYLTQSSEKSWEVVIPTLFYLWRNWD